MNHQVNHDTDIQINSAIAHAYGDGWTLDRIIDYVKELYRDLEEEQREHEQELAELEYRNFMF